MDEAVQAPPRRAHEDPAILAVSLAFSIQFALALLEPIFLDENNDGCKRVNLVLSESAKKNRVDSPLPSY